MNSITLLATAALAIATSAAAAPVSVTDTVTAGVNGYIHSFSLTNDIGGDNTLYFFGVNLAGSIIDTPLAWVGTGFEDSDWTNASYGGSSTLYQNTWCCAFSGTPSGTTTTGFTILSALNPTTIKFFAYASGGVDDAADGHFSDDSNPGFEGVVGGAVPEPATWALMVTGFGLIGFAARRRAIAIPLSI